MRCLALAQAWARRGGQCIFLLNHSLPTLQQRLLSEGFQFVPLTATANDVDQVLELGRLHAASWVVLDGYAFTSQHQEALLNAGFRVLVIDDYGQTDHYPADIVLNQNIYSTEEDYEKTYTARSLNTQLLLGTDYSLLRGEFLPWSAWKRRIRSNTSRFLITLGGSAATTRSLDVLRALPSSDDVEVALLAGGSAQLADSLEAEAANIGKNILVVRNTSDMPGWMAWADIAVAGAGVTSYELLFMGLPSVLLVLAENQRPVADCLTKLGVSLPGRLDGASANKEFGTTVRSLADSSRRDAISQASRNLVDGLGSDRVCAAMLGKQLQIRPPQARDCDLLFRWANDPQLRAVSFHSEPISRSVHESWFAAKLNDPAAVFHLGEDTQGHPVGQVRYQIEASRAILSINIDSAMRGQGWGRELLYFSTRMLFRKNNTEAIDAFVQPANHASLRLFEEAGFENAGSCEINGRTAIHFVLKVPQPPTAQNTALPMKASCRGESA
jgi:UDP-2,4-diacetamido-2,4,6-trideoxy-beta-L-altropyranose hydrolase